MTRPVVAAMTAYTLELREADVKLNQNESPFDLPLELKQEVLTGIASRPWNIYPDFEAQLLREALARHHGLEAAGILVGNGSNELLAAAIGTYVGPGTPVILPRPAFTLYEKLVTIASGTIVPVMIEPESGFLPLEEMLRAIAQTSLTSSSGEIVVILCSPNNPTGGVLPPGGLEQLLAAGATVLFDRAYGDFALDTLPPLHPKLVTFSTFSKAWGLAALRIGWLASTAENCREIRKVKLPYSLNVISEAIAALALQHDELRTRNVHETIAERQRVFGALSATEGITPFPTEANFVAFRVEDGPKPLFENLHAQGVLIRDISSAVPGALRVSIGSREQNDRFLGALRHSLSAAGKPARIAAGTGPQHH